MRKLSLLAAAAVVMAWAGNAQAATSSQTLTATANIAAVVTLTPIDATFECGTVTGTSIVCDTTAARNASFTVKSNSDWTLTLADDTVVAPATTGAANQITLKNIQGVGYTGEFVLKLVVGQTSGTSTGGVTVNITEATSPSLVNLDATDEYGSYSGTGTLTLTGT